MEFSGFEVTIIILFVVLLTIFITGQVWVEPLLDVVSECEI